MFEASDSVFIPASNGFNPLFLIVNPDILTFGEETTITCSFSFPSIIASNLFSPSKFKVLFTIIFSK